MLFRSLHLLLPYFINLTAASHHHNEKRGAETNATLYAYGADTPAWPIAYGVDDGASKQFQSNQTISKIPYSKHPSNVLTLYHPNQAAST